MSIEFGFFNRGRKKKGPKRGKRGRTFTPLFAKKKPRGRKRKKKSAQSDFICNRGERERRGEVRLVALKGGEWRKKGGENIVAFQLNTRGREKKGRRGERQSTYL